MNIEDIISIIIQFRIQNIVLHHIRMVTHQHTNTPFGYAPKFFFDKFQFLKIALYNLLSKIFKYKSK